MKERDEQQNFCRMGGWGLRRVGTRNSARGLVKAKLALHDCMTKRKKDKQHTIQPGLTGLFSYSF